MTKNTKELQETEIDNAIGGGVIFCPAGGFSPDDPIFYGRTPKTPQRDGLLIGGDRSD